MGAIVDHAKEILAADMANKLGITLEAADDMIKEFNWKIIDFIVGEDTHYETLGDIFDDYGIPRQLAWVFECTTKDMDKL